MGREGEAREAVREVEGGITHDCVVPGGEAAKGVEDRGREAKGTGEETLGVGAAALAGARPKKGIGARS